MRQLPVLFHTSGLFVLPQAPVEATEDSPLETEPSSSTTDPRHDKSEREHVQSENLFQRTEVLAGEHLTILYLNYHKHPSVFYLIALFFKKENCPL